MKRKHYEVNLDKEDELLPSFMIKSKRNEFEEDPFQLSGFKVFEILSPLRILRNFPYSFILHSYFDKEEFSIIKNILYDHTDDTFFNFSHIELDIDTANEVLIFNPFCHKVSNRDRINYNSSF